MQNKTKEQCLSEATGIELQQVIFKNEICIVRPSESYEAMETYANQQEKIKAVEFAEWTQNKSWKYQSKYKKWFKTYPELKELTTSELYELFTNKDK